MSASTVIAWRIPSTTGTLDVPIGVVFGYSDEPFDRPDEDHVKDADGKFSMTAFAMPDGMVACRLTVRTRKEFIDRAFEDLTSYLDSHFGQFEALPFRPKNVRRFSREGDE